MRNASKRLWVVVLGFGLLAGCTKTVEGENKAWLRNVQRVGEMSATYPAFATALAEQKKRAEDAMAAARAVSDKEQSAKKMSEANDLLETSFVNTLSNLDGKQKSLRTKLISATTEAEHASDQAGARAAVEDAQRILRNFDDAIKAGAPTADAAQVVVRKIDGDLSSATTNVDKVISAAKARKDAAAKPGAPGAPGTAAAPGGAPPAPGAPVPKPQWKCEYCKAMNDDSRTTCSSCGAAKPAPGAAKPAPGKPAPGKPAGKK